MQYTSFLPFDYQFSWTGNMKKNEDEPNYALGKQKREIPPIRNIKTRWKDLSQTESTIDSIGFATNIENSIFDQGEPCKPNSLLKFVVTNKFCEIDRDGNISDKYFCFGSCIFMGVTLSCIKIYDSGDKMVKTKIEEWIDDCCKKIQISLRTTFEIELNESEDYNHEDTIKVMDDDLTHDLIEFAAKNKIEVIPHLMYNEIKIITSKPKI